MSRSPDPEYRRCPASGRWVIIAPARALRPITLTHAAPHHRRGTGDPAACPLCAGREAKTPGEVYAVGPPGRAANAPGWELRVVPNKYPAVHPIADPVFAADGALNLFDSLPGFGEHELVVECPDHRTSPTELTVAETTAVLAAYRERLAALAGNPVYQYAAVFKNVGAEAGASLDHLHSQIVAMPVVPAAVRGEIEAGAEYRRRRGRCVFCDLLAEELIAGDRVVADSPGFVAVCPFAPRFAYEVWVLPRGHDSRYETLTDAAAADLAGLLRRVLAGLDAVLGEPAYNYWLHTGPLRAGPLPHYHWHVEVIPRVTRPAGFEWGSGCFINAIPPERAAEELRAAVPLAG